MRSLLSRFLLIGVALFATPALAVSNSSGGINVSPSVQGISTDSCETYGASGAYVQKIFMAYLGRPAAPAALEYYASFIDLDVGQGKLVLFDDLYYSAEAQQLYRSMPLADQINQFYVLMFGREAKTEGIDYWVGEIEAGRFTVPAAAAFIADAASAEDLAVLDAKQVAASKVTCAIGDDEGRLSVFQSNLDEARSSLAEIVTAEQAEAYTGYEDLIAADEGLSAFDKITFDQVLAVDPEYDDIWAKADSYDIHVDLTDLTHHGCQLDDYDSGQWPHNEVDQLYEIREIDLNSDNFPDYMLLINCRSLNPGVGDDPRYYEFDVYEPFVVMMCGDESGLYNCTQDITGHATAFNMSMPGGWPGMGALAGMIFQDLNGDGVRDLIIEQSLDVTGDNAFDDPNYDSGTPALERGYGYYGYTKAEMIEICEWIWPNNGGVDNCFIHRTEQTYALSNSEGVWELKRFESPEGIWNGYGTIQLYLIDGEYHVNWDGQDSGMIRWFRFDQRSQEFVFVTLKDREDEYGPTPIDTTEQSAVEQYIVNPETQTKKYRWFTQTGDFETRTQDRDDSLNDLNVGVVGCEDIGNFDYDLCNADQLHVWKRDSSGKVTKFFEYRPGDWADEIRTRQPYEMINGELSEGVRGWRDQESFSMYLHGYWVNTQRSNAFITGGMRQLEDRPDAPWYFIVSYYGYQDMRNPGAEYQPEFVWRGMRYHKPEDRTDYRFYQNDTEIVFKYLVDMETGELTYAGTLFEHPWVYFGFDTKGPDFWNWTDVNGDGYIDPQIVSGPFGLAWLSNDNGELQYVDREQSSPLYQYGELAEHPVNYRTWTNFGKDLGADGITDLFMIVNGEELHNDVDVYRGDQRTKDLYERDRTYIDIIYGDQEWIPNSPVLDAAQIRRRIDACIDRHNNSNFWISQAPQGCYRKEIW